MNGVKNKAIENAVSKARTQARLNSLDRHHVQATTIPPMVTQTQGVRIMLIMDNSTLRPSSAARLCWADCTALFDPFRQ